MRITCPHCGTRSHDEFVYYGDAAPNRPNAASPNAMSEFVTYAYERTNAPGVNRELWYHESGCHAWLVVARNVSTHEIFSVEIARDVALGRAAKLRGSA